MDITYKLAHEAVYEGKSIYYYVLDGTGGVNDMETQLGCSLTV